MPPTNNLLRTENLINPQPDVSLEKKKRPASFYKAIVFDALSLIFAALFGYSYYRYLAGALSPWLLILALLLLGLISGLQALTNRRGIERFVIMCGEVLLMSVFFYAVDPPFLTTAALLTLGFFVWGYIETRRDLSYATEIRFFTITRGVMGKFITGALLFMIILYVPQRDPQSLFVSEHSFGDFFSWAANAAQGFYPNIPLSGSLGDFAQSMVLSQLKTNPQFQTLSPQNQSTTIAENATQLVANFSKSLGVAATSSDSIASVIYRFIVTTFQGWQNHFSDAFIIGWTVVLFLILRSFGIVFSWLCQIVLVLVYEFLVSTGFLKVTEIATTKETIGF